jgi:sterol desaturase/sphingolipid hydroxylase (fatty acid hydroxylase superfamily)
MPNCLRPARASSALNAQFEHANIRLPEQFDRWLRLVFVTPNMHKMHHSRQQPETDSNYSNLPSIWDRLGTITARASRNCAMVSTDSMIPNSNRLVGCSRCPS